MRPTRPAVVGSTTGRKIHTSRSDDGKRQWRNSGTSRPCRNSPPSTPRSTITLTTIATSADATSSSSTAPPRWPSGVNWQPDANPLRALRCLVRISLTLPNHRIRESSKCVTPLVSGPMAHRYPHRHATLREQYHARDRYRLVPGRALEPGGADERGQHGCGLDEREGRTDTDPWARAEWHELIARITDIGPWRETGRIKAVRVVPQVAVAVDHVNRQADERAGLNVLAGQFDILCGVARHQGQRRKEPQRLLQHLLHGYQLVNVLTGYGAGGHDLPDFLQHAGFPFRRARRQIERPGQRHGDSMVAGQQERQKIVDELLVRHRLAGLRVDRAEQPGKEVVAIVGGGAACVDQAGNGGPETRLPKVHAAAPRARQPDRQVERRIGHRPGKTLHIVSSPLLHRFADEGTVACQQRAGDDMIRGAHHVSIDGVGCAWRCRA